MATTKTPAASAAARGTFAKLREPFTATEVKQRAGAGWRQLDYVAIETVLQRLLDVAPEYSWEGRVVQIENGTAVVEGVLTIAGKTGFGVGAMTNPDPDMAVKSANSEAIKNAAKNGFGVALELWDEEHRALLDKQRKFGGGTNVAAMKKEVYEIARARIGKDKPTLAEVAKYFDVKPGELGEAEVLVTILETRGVL